MDGDNLQVFRGIHEAATASTEARWVAEHRYVAGLVAGHYSADTTIAVINATTTQVVELKRFSDVEYDLQRGRLSALFKVWQPVVIWAETNSIGSMNIEKLQRARQPVRPFNLTARSKVPLIERLALAIERGKLSLLPDPVLLDELTAYTIERLPSGRVRYSAPAANQGDTVIALALAWHGVSPGTIQVSFA